MSDPASAVGLTAAKPVQTYTGREAGTALLYPLAHPGGTGVYW